MKSASANWQQRYDEINERLARYHHWSTEVQRDLYLVFPKDNGDGRPWPDIYDRPTPFLPVTWEELESLADFEGSEVDFKRRLSEIAQAPLEGQHKQQGQSRFVLDRGIMGRRR